MTTVGATASSLESNAEEENARAGALGAGVGRISTMLCLGPIGVDGVFGTGGIQYRAIITLRQGADITSAGFVLGHAKFIPGDSARDGAIDAVGTWYLW